MSGRRPFYKPALALLIALLLAVVGFVQGQLNRQRAALGLTRVTPLENAPPMLAFTTVALGGFRGLISNALWIRANELQNDGKYFEIVQLADWITKLEPTFDQVWKFQAWNMAYNISVKFSDPADRWRWVKRGIELIRDEGLRYNPHETLLYHELAWHYQHKLGQNLDDAHRYYKEQWAREMEAALGSSRTNLAELVNPQTPELQRQAETLKTQYKLDPKIMKEVDDQYGPLEWRLPEAHAIYWAVVGLKNTSAEKQNASDLRTLRRVVYQSMHQSVLHGRITSMEPFRFGPDLTKVESASDAFEKMIAIENEIPDAFRGAHRNFLREVVYQLFVNGQRREAERWLTKLKEQYPGAVPPGMTAEHLALARLQLSEINSMGHDRVKAVVEGMLRNYYLNFALDDDELAGGMEYLARSVYSNYSTNINRAAVSLPPYAEMKQEVLDSFLDPQSGLDPRVPARLRTKLGLPAATNAAPTAPSNP